MPKLELYRTKNKQFSWRLRADNGRIIASPHESYKRRAGMLNDLYLVFRGWCFDSDQMYNLTETMPVIDNTKPRKS